MFKRLSCFGGFLADWFQGTNEVTPAELELAGGRVSPGSISFSLRTGSVVDVGSWFRKARVMVCVLPDDLLLVAPGKCPYVDLIPFSDLQESLYNHVTGEVVLAPGERLRVRRLRVSPLDGSRILKCLHVK